MSETKTTSVYDALLAAGHTEEDIKAHLFATACSMEVARRTGVSPYIGVMVTVTVVAEKLGIDTRIARKVVGAVCATMAGDAEFRKAVEDTVTQKLEIGEDLGLPQVHA